MLACRWLCCALVCVLYGWVAGLPPQIALAGPLSPEEAEGRFRVADGLEVKLFAAEPLVRQPVTMTFDDRGRLWVIQYLQYPAPAGLKPVEVDQYLRTRYDRVPEPPPRGPQGADRITILEDTDGDGRADRAHDFVAGLNLASALALGDDGVYVGQAPYLLFYPDRDHDDRPDGDPEVLLSGFGLEDAHAVVNSLVWGPDGWLYGAQGSTVTANVRGVTFQQGIWRYHPRTKEFELFAEGGGNTWGVDFDRHGNLLAGTNFSGAVLLHQVPGGYYVKGFAKHGPLHNPYAYGYFEHAAHAGFRGGHVTCGGIVYQGNTLDERYQGRYLAANVLSNAIYSHEIESVGSTFKTRQGNELLGTDDVWFRPVDCLAGPDGALWIADWYDQRANHVIPEDTWDKTNGRIWRVQAKGAMPAAVGDLRTLSSQQLIGLLGHANDWQRRQARRLLAERRDADAYAALRKLVEHAPQPELQLQALWALCTSGGCDERYATELLTHQNADVRVWAVRWLGDRGQIAADTMASLVKLAELEPEPGVRSQLASSARYLSGPAALAIVEQLARHSEDRADLHIPLLLWWAIEPRAVAERAAVLERFASLPTARLPIVSQTLAPRLLKRYAAEDSDEGYAACAQVLAAAPSEDARALLFTALSEAFFGRRLERVPKPLEPELKRLWQQRSADPQVVRLALRLGSPLAWQRALAWIADPQQAEPGRLLLIEAVGQAGRPDAVTALLPLFNSKQPETIRLAALAALDRFADPAIAARLLDAYPQLSPALRSRALHVLAGRKPSASLLLAAVRDGRVAPADVSVDHLRRIMQLADAEFTAQVEERWGKVRAATPGEKQAQIVVLARALSEGLGNAERGRKLFAERCGVCHTLHGEGAKVGPDLTGAERKNRGLMLLNIVDPSNSIRPEYLAHTIVTGDGRVLSGIVAESSGGAITLVDAKNQRTTLAREEIDQMHASPQSLMPERLLEQLSGEQLRDLFSYLESDAPQSSP